MVASLRSMSKQKSKRLSLAELLAQLADPRPRSFHPDEDEQDQLGGTSAIYLRGDGEEEEEDHTPQQSSLRASAVSWNDDPRYAGIPVSRRDLEDEAEKEDYMDEDEGEELSSGRY